MTILFPEYYLIDASEMADMEYTSTVSTEPGFLAKKKNPNRLRYYIFVMRWLWRKRNWQDSRQKYKAMNREWRNK